MRRRVDNLKCGIDWFADRRRTLRSIVGKIQSHRYREVWALWKENAEKIKVTGSKFTDKKYYTHSLYPGGLKTRTFKDLNEKNTKKSENYSVLLTF